MAGRKGRSGRKTKSYEQMVYGTIDTAWQIYTKALHDPATPLTEKLELAKLIVTRDISRNQNIKVKPDVEYVSLLPEPEVRKTIEAPKPAIDEDNKGLSK